MYYIEQICNPALRSVRITIHGEQIVNAMWYRDYKAAVPGKPYVKECVDGRVIYVDACETWEEANERAGQLAQENGTLYSLDRQLAHRHRARRRRFFGGQ